MTGTDRIKEKILEDANAAAARIEDQARREARGITDQAMKEAELKKEAILKKAQSDSLETYRRLMAVAGLESRKEILRAKQEMVDTAFQTAMRNITELPDKEYQKLLEDLIVRAARGSGEILLSARDRSRVGAKFAENVNKRLKNAGINANLTLSKDTIETAGGFILRSGDMEINSTFEILFGMLRPELEGEVVKILFQ